MEICDFQIGWSPLTSHTKYPQFLHSIHVEHNCTRTNYSLFLLTLTYAFTENQRTTSPANIYPFKLVQRVTHLSDNINIYTYHYRPTLPVQTLDPDLKFITTLYDYILYSFYSQYKYMINFTYNYCNLNNITTRSQNYFLTLKQLNHM